MRLWGVLFGLFAALTDAANAQVTLHHVHGLAYSADGARILIPSHHGLAVYENGRWSKAAGPEHDYMGFSATKDRLYSSGHPAPGSGLLNPFGLIRSRDGGRTWDKLGLEGETDFHLLATGWNTNAIYVWNPAPSSRMNTSGLHYTFNDGFTWKRAGARGLGGELRAIAVHPHDIATVAVATSDGLYLSRDYGETFSRLAGGGEALSAMFDLDGKSLWFGAFDQQPTLMRVPLSGGNPQRLALPPLRRDAVSYIAQNPVRPEEYAIATFERGVYLSTDGGKTWAQIADRGKTNNR